MNIFVDGSTYRRNSTSNPNLPNLMSDCSNLRAQTHWCARLLPRFSANFAFVALILLTSSLSAQSASVTGRVSNALTGSYLTNARVTAVDQGKTVFTNAYGEYRLVGLNPGEVTLEVFYTGLDANRVTVTASDGQPVARDFALTNRQLSGDADTVMLDAFVVQAVEQAADAVAINEQRFSANIKNVVSADAFGDVTEGNPGEFLKYLPGVSVDYVAADVRSISVRGFGSAFTSVNVDDNRMASAASSGASRSFELEQVSMNNVARLEVVKVPLPSMPADSLGGSVNLVSKNAFERDKAEFKYRFYTSISDENLSFGKSPGPGVETSRKIRPGYDFSYTNPLSDNFGLILNGLHSDQFNEQHRSRSAWQTSGGAVASPSNPYMRTYTVQDGPKETQRESLGLNLDWKLTDHSVLSFGYQWNDYQSFFGNRNYNINAGSSATDFSATHTNGRTRAGEVTGGMSHRHKFGTTNHGSLEYKFYGDDLELNVGGYYSYATNEYDDTERGAFSGVNTRARSLTVSHNNINGTSAPDMTIKDAAGADFDWTDISNYKIRNVRSSRSDSWDEFTGLHVDATKSFDKFSLKVGLNSREQERDLVRRTDDYDYFGPDGKAESDDDWAAPFADTIYVGQDPHYGLPAPTYVDPGKVYQHFLAHPEYFKEQTANWSDRVKNDYNVIEKVEAGYIQGDVDLAEGRLKLIGGLRYEKTSLDGIGYLYTPDAIFDGSGNLISDDPLTQERLKWHRRGQSTSNSYDGVYPSAHLVYNINDNLMLRMAYAKTIGRPDFSNILPGTEIDDDETPREGEPGGRITVRNPDLKPYQSDNFDVSLDYYFEPAGVLSLGVFHKDVTNFFGGISKLVDQDDLVRYNLDQEYLGYSLNTKINSGDAKISGIEFNYSQQLVKLPGIWSNLSVFANATKLDLKGGTTADWSGFIEESGNWGVSYSGQKFGAKVKWNYRGKQFRSFQSAYGPGGGGVLQGTPLSRSEFRLQVQQEAHGVRECPQRHECAPGTYALW